MSIQITEVRNAVSKNVENTWFEVEINHPQYGWIPYALTPWDTDNTVDNNVLLDLIGENFEPFSQAAADAELADFERFVRNALLENEVDPIVANPLRWGELTEAKQTEWATYRTDLLNVPQQAGFPNTITWPTKPE